MMRNLIAFRRQRMKITVSALHNAIRDMDVDGEHRRPISVGYFLVNNLIHVRNCRNMTVFNIYLDCFNKIL